ncbi:MAG: hypothetical protein RL199_1308 [Pseudomonadota bacterium]|jgi:hypothetical protein
MARPPRWQAPLDFGASTPKPESRVEYDKPARRPSRETSSIELPWAKRTEPVATPPRVRPTPGAPSLQRAWEGLLAEAGWGATLVPAHRALLEALVRDLDLRSGVVEATVGAGRERPHRVQLRTGVLSPAEWARLVRHVVDAGGVEAMLEGLDKGELSLGLLDAFDACELPLLPRRLLSLVTACTCGGAKAPCDHVMSTHLSLARRLGKEPSRAIVLRGGDVGELKTLAGRLRAERLAAIPATEPALDPWTSPRPFVLRELPPSGPRRPLPAVEGWRAAESLEAMAVRLWRAKTQR